MQVGRLLGYGKIAEVYEAGADVLKLYRAGTGPEQARHEAMILQVLEGHPIDVPRALGVVEQGGRWGLLMSRISGRPLAEMPSPVSMVETMVGLHGAVHALSGKGLPALRERLVARIGQAARLTEGERARLLERLLQLPDGDRLCHGDFHPFNIMVDGERLAVIDWLDATNGPPAADVGRTYLLALHNLPELAEPYLVARLRHAPFDRQAVMDWLPVLAGARLAENVPEEDERLLALVRA